MCIGTLNGLVGLTAQLFYDYSRFIKKDELRFDFDRYAAPDRLVLCNGDGWHLVCNAIRKPQPGHLYGGSDGCARRLLHGSQPDAHQPDQYL